MAEPKVVEWLRAGHTVDELAAAYSVCVKRHPEFPSLVFLKYDQINSPMGEPMVQECRGLILDEADGWRVVSRPFDKFWNAGEPCAATIDWNTARVFEKLDGSLMTLHWYAGAWRVASNGTPDAGGNVYGYRDTFADLFWETWRTHGYELPRDTGRCYMFELMTPFNRVVVPHARSRLVLIGVREVASGIEHPIDSWTDKWETVRSFPLACLSDCVAAAGALDPMQAEGFVVCDAAFNRVKIKSPKYVAMAHMRDEFSARRVLDVIRAGEATEFLTYFPEMKPGYEQVKAAYDAACDAILVDYMAIRHIEDQKAFAMEAAKTRCPPAVFAMRNGKAKSPVDFLARATQPLAERIVFPGGMPVLELAGTGGGA